MKTITIVLTTIIIASCSSSKKSTSTTSSNTTPASTLPLVLAKSDDGVYAPGNEELIAIQAKYKEVSMKTLTDGHAIYVGICTNCHEAKSIYSRSEDQWLNIIEDMASRANITNVEKDAVLKYVLAIKATQPK